MSPSQDAEDKEPLPYFPRPVPGRLDLLTDMLQHRAKQPLGLLAKAGEMLSRPEHALDGLRRRARAIGEIVDYAVQPASETPINGKLSQHRRFDWLTMPLGDFLELRKVLGCTVNDVVLATVAGAVRRYLFRHRVELEGVDFRVAAPVSTRKVDDKKAQGNHVSTWIVPLPLSEADPLARVAAIRTVTEGLKRNESALAIETLMAAAEFMPPALIARGANMAQGPINMMVTNVPGPRFPLYQIGAKLLGMYPVVPLVPGSGLGIALFSYEGKLCWGINADYELVPDIEALADDLRASFEELRAAAVSNYLERRTAPPETAPTAASERLARAKTRDKKRRSRRAGVVRKNDTRKNRAARPAADAERPLATLVPVEVVLPTEAEPANGSAPGESEQVVAR